MMMAEEPYLASYGTSEARHPCFY